MSGFKIPELIVIPPIAFFLSGGKKPLEIGTGAGKTISSCKEGLNEDAKEGKRL
jgi:sec-independent protein translocase protein TatA